METYGGMASIYFQPKSHTEKRRVMSTTQPIRRKEDLEALKNFYLTEKPNLRNYALICTAVNTALRIGDILLLKWENVYDLEMKCFRTHLELTEQKTKKRTIVALNNGAKKGLLRYLESISPITKGQYIFTAKHSISPLSREQAYRIVHDAGIALQIPEKISPHSLRKTFGYYAWVSGASPALLVSIYNHSSYEITKRYLGIEQDDKDQVFFNTEL